MSAALMGYPAYTLVNWNDHEDSNPMKQHLAKIEGAIGYLDSLPKGSQDDLVLFLDGYDVWFQLTEEYIIKRYKDVVVKAHRRNIEMLGKDVVAKHSIKNTVLFGPDKQCAPAGGDHPSCWAVPESWMHPLSFGPDTDHGVDSHNRPRWLNSGTIMGPWREVRDVVSQAAEEIKSNKITDSDQFYFASVFGTQSYARRLLKLHRDSEMGLDTTADREFLDAEQAKFHGRKIPSVERRTEYFIGLDWSSAIFQTTGFYADYISWIRDNDSSSYVQKLSAEGNYHHHSVLQQDLEGKGPGWALASIHPALAGWNTLPLATNIVSHNVPAVMHINGKKGYRILWWPRMWFFPYIERIWDSFKDRRSDPKSSRRVAFEGAWTIGQAGTGWIDWEDICGKYESRLQGKSQEPDP
ncbi:hypothetical protein Q7P37_009763 [Cladosporium fusiforme]